MTITVMLLKILWNLLQFVSYLPDIPSIHVIILWYFLGLIFAMLVGDYFTKCVASLLKRSIKKDLGKDYEHYSKYSFSGRSVGFIERALFLAAFLNDKAIGIIGVWLALKAANQWIMWRGQKGKKAFVGRAIYNNFLINSAHSLIYSYAGYKIISWLQDGKYSLAIFVATITVLSSIVFYFWLEHLMRHKN